MNQRLANQVAFVVGLLTVFLVFGWAFSTGAPVPIAFISSMLFGSFSGGIFYYGAYVFRNPGKW